MMDAFTPQHLMESAYQLWNGVQKQGLSTAVLSMMNEYSDKEPPPPPSHPAMGRFITPAHVKESIGAQGCPN